MTDVELAREWRDLVQREYDVLEANVDSKYLTSGDYVNTQNDVTRRWSERHQGAGTATAEQLNRAITLAREWGEP